MEKGTDMNTAASYLVVNVSPEQLRNIANKLESKAGLALPGQTITYPFSPQIVLAYEPRISVEKFAIQIVQTLEKEKEEQMMLEANANNKDEMIR